MRSKGVIKNDKVKTFDYSNSYRDAVVKQMDRLSRLPAVEGMIRSVDDIDITKVLYYI